jgi:hypothetical protein
MKSKYENKSYDTLDGVVYTIFILSVLAGIVIMAYYTTQEDDGWLEGGIKGTAIIVSAYLFKKIIEVFIDIAKNTQATRELLEKFIDLKDDKE